MALVHVDLVLANERDVHTSGVFFQKIQDGVGVVLGLEKFAIIVAIVFGS